MAMISITGRKKLRYNPDRSLRSNLVQFNFVIKLFLKSDVQQPAFS